MLEAFPSSKSTKSQEHATRKASGSEERKVKAVRPGLRSAQVKLKPCSCSAPANSKEQRQHIRSKPLQFASLTFNLRLNLFRSLRSRKPHDTPTPSSKSTATPLIHSNPNKSHHFFHYTHTAIRVISRKSRFARAAPRETQLKKFSAKNLHLQIHLTP